MYNNTKKEHPRKVIPALPRMSLSELTARVPRIKIVPPHESSLARVEEQVQEEPETKVEYGAGVTVRDAQNKSPEANKIDMTSGQEKMKSCEVEPKEWRKQKKKRKRKNNNYEVKGQGNGHRHIEHEREREREQQANLLEQAPPAQASFANPNAKPSAHDHDSQIENYLCHHRYHGIASRSNRYHVPTPVAPKRITAGGISYTEAKTGIRYKRYQVGQNIIMVPAPTDGSEPHILVENFDANTPLPQKHVTVAIPVSKTTSVQTQTSEDLNLGPKYTMLQAIHPEIQRAVDSINHMQNEFLRMSVVPRPPSLPKVPEYEYTFIKPYHLPGHPLPLSFAAARAELRKQFPEWMSPWAIYHKIEEYLFRYVEDRRARGIDSVGDITAIQEIGARISQEKWIWEESWRFANGAMGAGMMYNSTAQY